ncbi:uncharacterized protein PV09_06315 [Verruconis gallopava]|uniref:Leucine rich repeat protein n=1 Tax=Verruconis gallopava TaxID=253628 RepID=A0A0D1YPH0_9PEZI|nr:uncharacterized protein PV09_06315 [Verruconis gallopava]KIW02517.1 hypothetical protein PV09_06315 [Verruconis gallopava]
MAPFKASTVKLKYTNRKSDGLRLAEIVAKDLRKHTAGFGKKNTVAETNSAPLELDLGNKEQTDVCIETFAESLLEALELREGVSPLRLEELSFRNNKLTTATLKLLAPVIHAARFDIRYIDLSHNHIRVATREEAEDFAAFIHAFAGCELMRRLDMSGNDFSGPLAMEILLREYCLQQPVDPSLLYHPTGMETTDYGQDMLSERTNMLSISSHTRDKCCLEETKDPGSSVAGLKVCTRRRGLRSIPYILLKDTKLDDAGALHLSYILEHHYWPQYLMSKPKDGSKEARRKEEDDVNGCFGIVFSGNWSLSPHGSKLLEYANAARAQLVGLQPFSQAEHSFQWNSTSPGSRLMRSSSTSSHSFLSDDTNGHRVVDISTSMQSLRMRLQRTTLEMHGVQSVQLWHAAMKILYAARVILPPIVPKHGSRTVADVSMPSIMPDVPEKTTLLIARKCMEQVTNASRVNCAIARTKTSRIPVVVGYPSKQVKSAQADHVSQIHSQGNDNNSSLNVATPASTDKGAMYDPANPMNLPTAIWRKIFIEYAESANLLSDEQIDKVIRYARDRSNIIAEMHSQAKGQSHQVWHILEQIDCFTYELKMAD